MSRYLVVSDNHGNLDNLKKVLKRYRNEIDGLIHCGDMEIPPTMLEQMAGLPVYMAEGNCDYYFDRDPEEVFELGDHHVALVTHGDRHGINWGTEGLLSRAQEMGADIVFFGHTHRPAWYEFTDEQVTMFNPGSIALPRQFEPLGPTFMILDIKEDGSLKPTFCCMSRIFGGKLHRFDPR